MLLHCTFTIGAARCSNSINIKAASNGLDASRLCHPVAVRSRAVEMRLLSNNVYSIADFKCGCVFNRA